MKIMKKRYQSALFLMLTIPVSIVPMDELPKPKKKKTTQRIAAWARTIGDVILGNIPMQEVTNLPTSSFPFAQLPSEIQQYIISLVSIIPITQNLATIGKTINALAQANRDLNQLFNNPAFSLQLIKSLSAKFDLNNETVCGYIQTQETKRLLRLQIALKNLSFNPATTLHDVITLRLQGADLNFTYKHGMTLLIFYIQNNDLLIVEYLLKKGANPNLSAPGGTTPLLVSVTYNNKQAVELLLRAGADPDLPDSTGMTPRFIAGMIGSYEIMKALSPIFKKTKTKSKKIILSSP